MIRADPDAVMPILRVRAGDVPRRMLVVGDPGRAERVARKLHDSRELSRNREYVMFTGLHRGESIGVVSHGVGSAGAAVCFEELCRSGTRRIVRAGTSGGLQPHVLDGSVVIVRGAVREDGVTAKLVPRSFPALASVDVVLAMRNAARAVTVPNTLAIVEGIVLTSGVFYSHDVIGSDLLLWQRAGVVAVEMECAALFVTAALHDVEAGAILAVDGNPLAAHDDDMSGYDPNRSIVEDAVDAMLGIALDVVAGEL